MRIRSTCPDVRPNMQSAAMGRTAAHFCWQLLAFLSHICRESVAYNLTTEPNAYTWLAVGADYSLGITTIGTSYSWGIPMSEREKSVIPIGYLWTRFFAGYSHTCGITEFAITMCWGRGHEGQCNIPQGYTFVLFTLGESHTCALTDTSEIVCWGTPLNFRLEVPKNQLWLSVDAGAFHTCAVNDRQKILCWGDGRYNRLDVAFRTELDISWEAVACGNRHCCGLLTRSSLIRKRFRQEDNVYCWGDNSYGQLDFPAKTEGRSGAFTRFRQISAGHSHTCGVTDINDVWCWGLTQPYGLIRDIPTGKNITRVWCGGHHACALTSNLTALCWGDGYFGQTTVPIDDRTLPPSILDYAKDPHDIYEDDPFHRVTKWDQDHPPQYSTQHVHMALYMPEFPKPGSLILSFRRVAGAPDPYSPHVLHFPSPQFDYPGVFHLNVSAFDL